MPILEPEVDYYPPELLESGSVCDSRRWRVAQTKPRQEKALARELHAAKVPFYLPCQRRRSRSRSRVVISTVPLLGGFIFLRSADDERWRIAATKRVAGFLDVRDESRLVDDLRAIWRLLDLGVPLLAEDRIVRGETVTVRTGPLAGMSGIVEQVAGGFKFVVAVDFLGRSVSATFEGTMLGRSRSLSPTPIRQRGEIA